MNKYLGFGIYTVCCGAIGFVSYYIPNGYKFFAGFVAGGVAVFPIRWLKI
jgi:hypothetical protein